MARKRTSGRPQIENPRDFRVMIRLTKLEGEALETYAHNSGIGQPSTAARAIVVERLIAAGLIKSAGGKS